MAEPSPARSDDRYNCTTNRPPKLEQVLNKLVRGTRRRVHLGKREEVAALVATIKRPYRREKPARERLLDFLESQGILLRDGEDQYFYDPDRADILKSAAVDGREPALTMTTHSDEHRFARIEVLRRRSAPPVAADEPEDEASSPADGEDDVSPSEADACATDQEAALDASPPSPFRVLFLTPVEEVVWRAICQLAKCIPGTGWRINVPDAPDRLHQDWAKGDPHIAEEDFHHALTRFMQHNVLISHGPANKGTLCKLAFPPDRALVVSIAARREFVVPVMSYGKLREALRMAAQGTATEDVYRTIAAGVFLAPAPGGITALGLFIQHHTGLVPAAEGFEACELVPGALKLAEPTDPPRPHVSSTTAPAQAAPATLPTPGVPMSAEPTSALSSFSDDELMTQGQALREQIRESRARLQAIRDELTARHGRTIRRLEEEQRRLADISATLHEQD